MLGMTAQEAARTLGAKLRVGGVAGPPPPGALNGQGPLDAVTADSRRVRPGTLFVALPGARTDGQAFLPQAAEAGAGAALVRDPSRLPPGMVGIVVRDTLAALQELSRVHLARLGAEVVGITGSVGKTTAKDFLHQLLGGAEAGVHAAPASYNSEIGLPLAILGAPPGTRRLVLEYGINAPGEMDALVQIAAPRHAWITAFRAVHLEGMGGLRTVVLEKCRLAEVAAGSVWMDDATVHSAAAYGVGWKAPLRLAGLEEDGVEVLNAQPGAIRILHPRFGERLLPLVARHEVHLACVAASLAASLGVSAEDVGTRLEKLERPPGRLTVREPGNGLVVLDDAYNASPASLRAALGVLRDWPSRGRRVAVLGTMHELGSAAQRLHEEAGGWLAEHRVDLLCAVGPGGAWFATAAARDGVPVLRCADATAAGDALAAELRAGDVVLLKASRAEALERVLTGIARRGEGRDTAAPAGDAETAVPR